MSEYPEGMKLRPIEAWPGPLTAVRTVASFSATLSSTIALLKKEMRQLEPEQRYYPRSLLQIAMREEDFRIDGMPRAHSKPDHPGIILSITPVEKPPMSFPCDRFTRWQDNLRGVALGMEALRKLDRYGIVRGDQQYRGWQAIEAAPTVDARAAAEAFLRAFAGAATDVPLVRVVRSARRLAHPDANYGAQGTWDRVQAAAKLLNVDNDVQAVTPAI